MQVPSRELILVTSAPLVAVTVSKALPAASVIESGKDFTWTGLSYRQASIRFDKPINRLILVFTKGGTVNYTQACAVSGLASYADFRDKGPVFSLTVPHKAGNFSIGSAAPSHDCWLRFTDIYGEVAA